MRVAIQVPIKFKSSERVKNKNFRDLCGKPFYSWLLDRLSDLPDGWDIFIDSEDTSVFQKMKDRYDNFYYHKRGSWFASNDANGNHLINQFAILNPDYDIYCQLYVTAIFLRKNTILKCVQNVIDNIDKYDSSFLVTRETGWIWYKDHPINYLHDKMNGLPRSQDAQYLKESTGLYVVKKNIVLQTGCRIGLSPFLYEIDDTEAFDVDVEDDIQNASLMINNGEWVE